MSIRARTLRARKERMEDICANTSYMNPASTLQLNSSWRRSPWEQWAAKATEMALRHRQGFSFGSEVDALSSYLTNYT